jgi:hypothetical protein
MGTWCHFISSVTATTAGLSVTRAPQPASRRSRLSRSNDVITNEEVNLATIRVDGGTQPRAEIDHELVDEYAELFRDGQTFPPIVVFFDGTDRWLADGFHRYYAAQVANLTTLPAEVHRGSRRDAILHSAGSNSTHGKRRTNADKRRAVEILLTDAEWGQWSDREIARQCGVGHTLVSDMRKEKRVAVADSDSQPAGGLAEPARRSYVTKHGTQSVMNVTPIGRGRSLTPEISVNTGQEASWEAQHWRGPRRNKHRQEPANLFDSSLNSFEGILIAMREINPEEIADDLRAERWLVDIDEVVRFLVSTRRTLHGAMNGRTWVPAQECGEVPLTHSPSPSEHPPS